LWDRGENKEKKFFARFVWGKLEKSENPGDSEF